MYSGRVKSERLQLKQVEVESTLGGTAAPDLKAKALVEKEKNQARKQPKRSQKKTNTQSNMHTSEEPAVIGVGVHDASAAGRAGDSNLLGTTSKEQRMQESEMMIGEIMLLFHY